MVYVCKPAQKAAHSTFTSAKKPRRDAIYPPLATLVTFITKNDENVLSDFVQKCIFLCNCVQKCPILFLPAIKKYAPVHISKEAY